MKKLIYLLFFFPSFLFGQSQLGFHASADLTGCNYGWKSITNTVRNSKEAKNNVHFGINYYQSLKEKMWLKVGLGYNITGYEEQVITGLRYGSQHDGHGGFNPNAPSPGTVGLSLKYNHHFLEIPIALRLDFSDKKLKPFLEVGISTMYYLQTVSIMEGNDKPKSVDKNRSNEINQIQIAPTFAFGFSYDLNDKWVAFAQPNFRYHLTKMVGGSSVREHQWSVGFALGVRMNLK